MSALTAFVSAWNSHDPGAVAACFAPDGARQQTAFPASRVEGRAALAEHVGEIMAAWPDCALEVVAETGAGDRVVLEWTFRGTQTGPYGPLPAHGGTTELAGVSVCTMAGDAIREERVYWDGATLMRAAGLLPG